MPNLHEPENRIVDDVLSPRTGAGVLWDIVSGLTGYQAVLVAHSLTLFPLLHKTPSTLENISQKLSIDMRPTEAIVFANVALGLLKCENERYYLTSLAEDYLLKESPTYFGGILDMLIKNNFATSTASVKEAVLRNSPQTYGGTDVFKSHEEQIERAKEFTRGMHSASMAPALVWPHRIDLSPYRRLLDIGGGSGAHCIGALRRWPQLTAIVFDIAPVCAVADEFITQYQLESRMASEVGDLWTSPYPDADIHFYSQIYHDWPPEKCEALTKKSFDSLPSGGRIIIHESLFYDDKTGPFRAAAGSIAMLLWTEGQQFSGLELRSMLQKAGFTDITTTSSIDNWSIVSGVKP